MARPRTPTAQLDAKGSFIKHPERQREGSESLESLPLLEAPRKGLHRDLKFVWMEIKSYLAPGVLKISDGPAFESLVRLIQKDRSGYASTSERGQMITLLSRFGMTPSDRSKVTIDAPKESPLAKFLSRAKPENQKPC